MFPQFPVARASIHNSHGWMPRRDTGCEGKRMSNLRPGIDDNFSDFGMIVRLNIPFDSRERMIAVLQAIALVQKEKMSPTRELGSVFGHDGSRKPRFVVADLRLNLLVGFGLRF